jgi:hypothetical protein
MSNFNSILSETVDEQARDKVGQRMLREYGAVFAAAGGAVPPDRLIFRDQQEVKKFQDQVEIGCIDFEGVRIELQVPAAAALNRASSQANAMGLCITPRGPDSGRRSYEDTVILWKSRVDPALDHWTSLGRLSRDDADRIRSLTPFDQVSVVLSLEDEGIFFAKDLSKSIVYSVAPPGTSQHLSMLAFDVREFNDPAVREILADNYWYQTVISDLPHFTYLGLGTEEMAARGLKKIDLEERVFWLPDLG